MIILNELYSQIYFSFTFCLIVIVVLKESANHLQWFVLTQKVKKRSRLDLFTKKTIFLLRKSPKLGRKYQWFIKI